MSGLTDQRGKTFSVSELAQEIGGSLRGDGSPRITHVNSLSDAGPTDITFIVKKSYMSQWPNSRAAAAVVDRVLDLHISGQNNDARPLIVVENAELAIARLLKLFEAPEFAPEPGVHPASMVHPTAKLGRNVRIGPHVSIDRGCRIGDNVILHPGVRLYADVSIDQDSVLHGNVVIRQGCRIGRGVILHQGASIGADGFGYRPDDGKAGLVKIPHIGTVIIEDDVEIGANTCVDRGKFGATIIGKGTKIDNLCQIAHNCRIGRCCVIAAQTGIAGSVTVGDGVMMGGQVGILEQLTIGDRARIGAQSGVNKDVPAGADWIGYPADDAQTVLRQIASVRKLPDLIRRMAGQTPALARPPAGTAASAQSRPGS